MKTLLASSSLLLAVATAAQAQTYRQSYTTSDGYGNSTTTTIEAPASVAGIIAGQTIYGGFPNYAGGVPSYNNSNFPVANNGYNTGYGYNGGYYNGGGYGYNNGYYNGGYNPNCQYPAPYAYPPQAYYVPGQTTYLPGVNGGPYVPPAVTTLPQVFTSPGVPLYPYGAYGRRAPRYGVSSRTTVTNGVVSIQKNGVNVTIGSSSSSTQTR